MFYKVGSCVLSNMLFELLFCLFASFLFFIFLGFFSSYYMSDAITFVTPWTPLLLCSSSVPRVTVINLLRKLPDLYGRFRSSECHSFSLLCFY